MKQKAVSFFPKSHSMLSDSVHWSIVISKKWKIEEPMNFFREINDKTLGLMQ